MPITINGAGTISGITQGGLPSDCITAEQLSFSTGKVLQVVSTPYIGTFSLASTTFTDVTDFSAIITPSLSTSKILVLISTCIGSIYSSTGGALYGQGVAMRATRNGVVLTDSAASGSRQSAFSSGGPHAGLNTGSVVRASLQGIYLDAPSSTSALTYQVQINSADSGTTAYVNRAGTDTNSASSHHVRTLSTITLMEIGL
jgi:hypothetical protein